MKKLFLADWSSRKTQLLTLPFMILSIYVVGTAFLLAVMHFDDADYFPFATTVAMGSLYVYAILVGSQFSNNWNMAGAMGATRKDYCWYMILRQLVLTAMGYGMILILRFAEDGLVRAVFGPVSNILDLHEIYHPGVAAAILLCSLVFQLMDSTLIVRFGQQGGLWFYLVSMSLVLIVTNSHSLLTYFLSLPALVKFLTAAIPLAACIAYEARTFPKMAVK